MELVNERIGETVFRRFSFSPFLHSAFCLLLSPFLRFCFPPSVKMESVNERIGEPATLHLPILRFSILPSADSLLPTAFAPSPFQHSSFRLLPIAFLPPPFPQFPPLCLIQNCNFHLCSVPPSKNLLLHLSFLNPNKLNLIRNKFRLAFEM